MYTLFNGSVWIMAAIDEKFRFYLLSCGLFLSLAFVNLSVGGFYRYIIRTLPATGGV